MLSNKEITRLARESLAGKWLFMALVTFVYTVVMGASSQVPLLMITGSCLIAGAMGVGYFSVCLRVARDQEIQLTDLFSGFKIFGRAFLLYLLVLIFLMLWTLLLFVPGVIAILRYSFVYLVAADEPSLSAVEIIQRSKRLTYGYKWQIFCLYFRFLGWFLLSSLSFGIGFFWSIPYFNQSITQLYLEVLQEKG